MKFLLFLLGIIFFFVFYVFSQISGVEGFFIKNLFWLANTYVFITLVIIFFLFNSDFSFSQKNNEIPEDTMSSKKYFPSFFEIQFFIKRLFSNYIYYIACVFFYAALYLILQSFYIDVSITFVFFVLNIIVISLYFLEHKIIVFQDFVRVNLVLISLYYIFLNIQHIIGIGQSFLLVDIVNICCVFVLFGIVLFQSRSEKYRRIVTHYCIAFSFIEIISLYKVFFSGYALSFGVIAFFLGIIFLLLTDYIHFIARFSKKIIRFWGVVFLCFFVFVSFFYVGNETGYILFLLPLLFGSSYVLFAFHQRFQNYIALGFSIFGCIAILYSLYSIFLPESLEKHYISLFCFMCSVGIIIFDRFFSKRFIYDIYFFHSLSLLVNLLGVFYFFYLRDFSILSLGILLFGESLYLFFSYYTISQIKKIG